MAVKLAILTMLLALASLTSAVTLASPHVPRPLPRPPRRFPRATEVPLYRSAFSCLPPLKTYQNPWACWWCVRWHANCPGYCKDKPCIYKPFVIPCQVGAKHCARGKSSCMPKPAFIPPPLLPGGSGFACAVGKLVERIKCCPSWKNCPEKCALCGLSFYDCPKFCSKVSPILKPYESRK